MEGIVAPCWKLLFYISLKCDILLSLYFSSIGENQPLCTHTLPFITFVRQLLTNLMLFILVFQDALTK